MQKTFKPSDYYQTVLGQHGFDVLSTGTSPEQSTYNCIVALEDADISVRQQNGQVRALTLPKGFDLYGQFTQITLTSGSLIAYKAK